MSDFKRADVAKIETFVSESKNMIKEFSDIRQEFNNINNDLTNNWEGNGKEAFKYMAENITEKIGGIEESINALNDQVLNNILEHYHNVDKELGEYNRQAGQQTEGGN